MLPIHQKAQILRRAGVDVPAPPQMEAGLSGTDSMCRHLQTGAWEAQVDALFTRHAIERATRSLQQAQSASDAAWPGA